LLCACKGSVAKIKAAEGFEKGVAKVCGKYCYFFVYFPSFSTRLIEYKWSGSGVPISYNYLTRKRFKMAKLSVDRALLKAKSYAKKGEIAEAQNLYQMVLQSFPKNKRAQKGLAALNKLQLPVTIPGPPQETINQLVNLYNQGQFSAVVEQAQTLTEQFPEAFFIWNILGVANNRLGQVGEASEAFKKVTELNPNYADGHNNLGVSLKRQGKLEEATEAYRKAISFKPNYDEAYYNMGNALREQGELEKAIDAYNSALSLKPDHAEAYYNKGISLENQGKLEEATEAYRKATSFKPDYAEAYNNMGNTLHNQGKLDDAIEAYRKALSLKPDYAEAYSNSLELLKISPSKSVKACIPLDIDKKVKEIGNKLLVSNSDIEIGHYLSEVLNCIDEEKFNFKTPLSQIYKRNSVDLNCSRHIKIFDSKNIIPEFCFGCFKVQVEVDNLFSLISLTRLFYDLQFEEDLTRKTIIELRPAISGFYKGLIYCRGLEQACQVQKSLDFDLKNIFSGKIKSQIKRGCSEFPLKFPKYGKITSDRTTEMDYPSEWRAEEDQFDQNNPRNPKENSKPSIAGFCLSDFYVIQKWIDYAKGLGDPSCESFENRPIAFRDIFEKAELRKSKFGKVFEKFN
jgi:tetratricopeptide (TPR) repeat protein